MKRGSAPLIALGTALLLALAGCDSLERSQNADIARHKMVGLTKEQVLACMGIPKQKAQAGATEVWSYHSTNGAHTYDSDKFKITSTYTKTLGGGTRSFCDVNVVMTNDVVAVVHYNGPRGNMFAHDEQCGFAIEHCVY